MKLISLKCPECKADLNIEEGRKMCYCQYCGTRILIDDNSSTHTYRKIDEARIKEAEADKIIRLKEIELEIIKEKRKRRSKNFTMIVTGTLLLISSFLLYLTFVDGNPVFFFLGILGILFGIGLVEDLMDNDKER